MDMDNIQLLGATFAPQSLDAKRIERYSKRGLIIESADGKLYHADLKQYTYGPRLFDDGMLRALVRLGRLTSKDVRALREKEKKAAAASRRAEDMATFARLAGRYGVALTKKQMAQFKAPKGGR